MLIASIGVWCLLRFGGATYPSACIVELNMENSVNLKVLALSRACTTSLFMVFPAALSTLLVQWEISAADAGVVQGAFSFSMAISLVLASVACDYVGAKRVLTVSTALSFISGLFATFFADGFFSALISFSFIGFAQGGSYAPAIILASKYSPKGTRNAAVGWMLAGMSAGYVISILSTTIAIYYYSFQAALVFNTLLSLMGAVLSILSTKDVEEVRIEKTIKKVDTHLRRSGARTKLLITGYIGHTWELLGMWAWIPAFMTASLSLDTGISGVQLGIWIAITLHLTGFFSSFLAGKAADRFGVRPVLIAFGLAGFICSSTIGWMLYFPAWIMILFVAIYAFVTIADSAVLSSAMTSYVPEHLLGRALGLRSILGIGAGSISPIFFGLTLDFYPDILGWGLSFLVLGAGGAVAFVCALLLKNET